MARGVKFSKGMVLNTSNSSAIVSKNGDISITIPRSSSFKDIDNYDVENLEKGEGALNLEKGTTIILNEGDMGFNFSSDGDTLILNLRFAIDGIKKEHAQ